MRAYKVILIVVLSSCAANKSNIKIVYNESDITKCEPRGWTSHDVENKDEYLKLAKKDMDIFQGDTLLMSGKTPGLLIETKKGYLYSALIFKCGQT